MSFEFDKQYKDYLTELGFKLYCTGEVVKESYIYGNMNCAVIAVFYKCVRIYTNVYLSHDYYGNDIWTNSNNYSKDADNFLDFKKYVDEFILNYKKFSIFYKQQKINQDFE